MARGLRMMYVAEQSARVDAYFEHVGRVDAYLCAVARTDAYLRVLAAAEADARAATLAAAAPPSAAHVVPVPRPAVPAPPTTPNNDSYVAGILPLINQQRAGAGLPPLSFNAALAAATQAHATALALSGTFSHTGPDGSTFGERIIAAGYPANRWMGEVIAAGKGVSAGDIVAMWMESAPHRKQVLSANFVAAGAGCASAGATIICVVDFGG